MGQYSIAVSVWSASNIFATRDPHRYSFTAVDGMAKRMTAIVQMGVNTLPWTP